MRRLSDFPLLISSTFRNLYLPLTKVGADFNSRPSCAVGVLHLIDTRASGAQSLIQQNDTDAGEDHHTKRPPSHLLLSAQVLFRAVLVPIGFFIMTFGVITATRHGRTAGERLAMAQIAMFAGLICTLWGAIYFM